MIIQQQSSNREFQVVIYGDKNIESTLLPLGFAILGGFRLEAYWMKNRGSEGLRIGSVLALRILLKRCLDDQRRLFASTFVDVSVSMLFSFGIGQILSDFKGKEQTWTYPMSQICNRFRLNPLTLA